MRIAFLTSEYPTEYADGGGLGIYVHRISKSLIELGHQPEVFVSSKKPSGVTDYEGVRVHQVNRLSEHNVLEFFRRTSTKLIRLDSWRYASPWVLDALSLAWAMERRHSVVPFELVQSADYLASGLFVRRLADRQHVVRCSTAADLYSDYDQLRSSVESWRAFLERLSMRRANLVYAPSQYVANHFRRVHGIAVRVIRPPVYSQLFASEDPKLTLPARFFFHFGQLNARKGTLLLAEALALAWRSAPDITMVWSGRCDEGQLRRWRSLWGAHSHQVQLTGPLTRNVVYSVLRQAELSVLPSQVDNLPNTVIESLMCGVPVLGSRGASIDELVEDGVTGQLVPLGDVNALAEALVNLWLNKATIRAGFEWNSQIAKEMHFETAVANLIGLVHPGCEKECEEHL